MILLLLFIFQVVEIAALLYVGQYVHARHVWRRWKTSLSINNAAASAAGTTAGSESSLLSDWWTVCAAMMESSNSSAIWSGLAHIQQTHPSPLNTYATEVGDMYRERIITKFGGGSGGRQLPPQVPPKQPYWGLLNFSSLAEYEQFCHTRNNNNGIINTNGGRGSNLISSSSSSDDESPSLTQIVAFLESSPWNVES